MRNKPDLKIKLFAFILSFTLIGLCLYGTGTNLGTGSRIQPDSALDELEIGLGAQQDDWFGWNGSCAGNLNGDLFDDVIVGAPGDDSNGQNSGAAYIFYGRANPRTYGLDINNTDVVLTGLTPGDNFGWDVASAGDVNGDTYDDIIIGAPGYSNENGKAYIFYGGSLVNGTAESADVILNGSKAREFIGKAVDAAGDVDNDNYDDVIVGAPNGDRAYIFYGQASVQQAYGDLWDFDADKLTPETDFTSGLNTTGNSPDYTGSDDGWDWYLTSSGPYGGDTSAVAYNADPNRDNNPSDSTIDVDDELIISIGDNYGNGNHDDTPESGAYGVQFEITSQFIGMINTGGTASISFDYYFDDSGTGTYRGLDANEEIWIKCRFGSTSMTYLGFDLDAGDNYADTTLEVYWDNDPNDISLRTFSYDVTNLITGVGSHYLDFGGKIRTWNAWGSSTEDGIFHFDNILLKVSNQKQSTILGGAAGTAFGASVAGLGNFNGDTPRHDDVAVGAPYTVKGHTYVFYGDTYLPNYIPVAESDVALTGIRDGGLFGWSVAGAGDINNDNFDDLLVGAPGADRAYVHYGKPSFTVPDPLYANLWDDNESTPNVVDFDLPGDEVNSTNNTFGLGATPSAINDDGWDWEIGTYGQNLKGGSTLGHHYDPEPETEGLTYDGSKRLEVQVGPTHAGGDGSNQEIMDSAAWGVQINITNALYNVVADGGEAYLSFVWEAIDTESPGSGTEEASYVKARFGTPTGYNYLGSNLGGDSEPELLYRATGGTRNNPWGPDSGWYIGRITNYMTQPGWYYADLGVKFDASVGGSNQGPNEGIRAYFDNIVIIMFPRIAHDIEINGTTSGEKFGFSVSAAGNVNNDVFDDIVIGAPGNDNANGVNSGAIYVITGAAALNSELEASTVAAHINYGESAHDAFGRAVACAGSVDGNIYSELFVGAPYKDSASSQLNIGKAYVLSVLKRPKITLNYPIGGEVVGGEIVVNATATDSDNNIDATGVGFYYSTDLADWISIGNDPTQDVGKFFTHTWNTSLVNDGVYYIKADISDLDLNYRDDISGSLTVDNQYPPEVEILKPSQDEAIFGQYQLNATGYDSSLDLIGGGLNDVLGLKFYLSTDNTTWDLLGNDNSTPVDDYYHHTLNTTAMVDGLYWLKVSIKDLDNTVVEDLVGFEIDNPSRAPLLELLYPLNETELSDVIIINATAFDMDNDINSSGVSFYYSTDEANWVLIGNDSVPAAGNLVYHISWDTTTVNDGWYWVKAFVNDTTGLSAANISNKFKIQNTFKNPPTVEVTYPNNGEEVRLSVKLEADAYDFDDNLNAEGVKFSYSSDRIKWDLIGYQQTPNVEGGNHYVYVWNTLKIPDGRYWLNASASDNSLLTGWDHSDEPFFLHNTELNPPFLNVVSPNGGEVLTGTSMINVNAGDLEENINFNGVSFYYASDKENWTYIANVPTPTTPEPVSPKMYSYSLDWDTTTVPDGEYWLRATATDDQGFMGVDLSDASFFIHNSQYNPPVVKVLYPNGGEILQGNTTLQGIGFDLEKNIDTSGIKFYYSNDNKNTWHLIGNSANGVPQQANPLEHLYEFAWETITIPDGIYWLKAEATDLTSLVGADLSDDSFTIHNDLFNAPIVKIISPNDNETVQRRIELNADVIDLEDNVKEVRFYYSSDQSTWTLIGTAQGPIAPGSDIYRVLWNTEDVYDGEYWLKIVAVDNNSLEGEGYSGVFFVDNGLTEPEEKGTEKGFGEFLWITIIIVIIIIAIVCILAIVWRRKSKEEKMEETLASITPTIPTIPVSQVTPPTAIDARQTLAEISPPTQPRALTPLKSTALPVRAPQSLLPGYKKPEGEKLDKDFQGKISTWKSQGYDVYRLEDLIETDMEGFWEVLPVFINNISKLNDLKPRFNALDTTGFEEESNSINSKFSDPDQALVVEQELQMLEAKIEQKEKIAEEEAAEEAKIKAEEATGDFDDFLPTLPAEDEDAVEDSEVIGTLPETESEVTESEPKEAEEGQSEDQSQ